MTTLNLKPFETLIHALWKLQPEISVKEGPTPVHANAVWLLDVEYNGRHVTVQWQTGKYRVVWQQVGGTDVVLESAGDVAALLYNQFQQPIERLEGCSEEDDAEGAYPEEPEIDPEEMEQERNRELEKDYTTVFSESASLAIEMLIEASKAFDEKRWHDLNQVVDNLHLALDVFKGMTVEGMDSVLVHVIQLRILGLLRKMLKSASDALKQKDWSLLEKSLEHVNALKMAVRGLDDL